MSLFKEKYYANNRTANQGYGKNPKGGL